MQYSDKIYITILSDDLIIVNTFEATAQSAHRELSASLLLSRSDRSGV